MCSLFLMQFLWCILKHLLIFATSGGFISMKYCIHDVVGCDCLHIKSILKSAQLDLNHKLYHNIKLQKASWSRAVYPEFKDNVFQILIFYLHTLPLLLQLCVCLCHARKLKPGVTKSINAMINAYSPNPPPQTPSLSNPHCISSTVPPPTISSSHQKNTRLYFALSLRVKKLLQRKKRSFNSNVAFDVDDSVLRININHVVG